MKTLVCTVGSITQVFIPDTVTKIGETAFSGCKGLTSADFSTCTNLTEIGEMAFENCTALAKVCLPASLTTIGWRAFNKCNNVQTLTVDPANTAFCSKDNVLYTKDMSALVYAAGGITQVCIPDTVTEICNYAFEGCKGLTSVDFSACTNLTKIGRGAFSHCAGLISLDLSFCTSLTAIKGVSFLDIGHFAYCTGLTEIRFPANLTEIGPGTFTGCTKLAEICLPESLTEIGERAFDGCTGLMKLDLSACTNLTVLGGSLF